MIDPNENLNQLQVEEGMRVADLGAGAGAHTFAAAKRVGETGRVYAVEIQKEVARSLKRKASEEHFENIEVFWGNIEEQGGSKLKEASVDVVLLINVIFQVEDTEGLVHEAKRILKPDGQLLVIDWNGSFGGIGPSEECLVSPERIARIVERSGFSQVRAFTPGEYHYAMIYTNKE